jgi:WD40 repeat protein
MPGMSYGGDLRFAACERAGLIACSIVNRIYLFSFDGAKMGEIKVAEARITAMDINSDGDDLVASGYEDGSLEFRRFSGEVVSRRDFAAGAVTAVSIAGRVVLAASDLGSVGVFDRSGNVISFFSAGGEVTAMAISPSGDTVALGCGDGSLRFFSVTGEPIREIPGGAAYDVVMRIAFSPDASLVAAGYSCEYLRVFDRAGNEMRRIPGYSGMLLMHAFDPSGRSLLFGDVDNDLEVIDTADWSPVATLVAAGEDYAVFTPDGRFDYTSPEMGARLVMKGEGGTVLPLSEEFRREEGLARRFFAQNP